MSRIRLVSVVFLIALLCGVSVKGLIYTVQAAPPQPGQLSAKNQKSAKVSQDLAQLQEEYTAHRRSESSEPFKPSNPLIRVTSSDLVVIDAVAAGDADILRADLEALGLQDASTFGQMVSGLLPISTIAKMDTVDSLRFVRPAYAMTNVGSVTSQGDVAMRADIARATYGVDGTGITVGTLSDSYNCLGGAATDVATGDLPAGINVLQDLAGPSCNGASDEGRGMMQLIRDVAPGANQAFHTAYNGTADFANGIVELATVANADVIVDDIIYYTEPMFQDGPIAQAVDTVEGMGVAYFSSAGNNNRDSYESAYRGGTDPAFHLNAHDFNPGAGTDFYQNITIPVGTQIYVVLQWDEPYFSATGLGGATNDIDIYLLNNPPTGYVAKSDSNNLGGDPIEIFYFFNNGSYGTTNFNLYIRKVSGTSPGLMKYVLFSRPSGTVTVNEYFTNSSTVYGHANAAGAEAVGAAYYGYTPAYGIDPALLESYSSAGPTPILFDLTNTPINEVRPKPEIVCPDGGNTTFFGFDIEPDGYPNFFGTSAAAPHAAGVAALMLEANSTLPPTVIYSFLEDTADDMGPAGFDDDSGFGLCQADEAVEASILYPRLVYLPLITKYN